jgi:16S rRNA (guanine966-N2)-methyltransferase
MQRVVSGALRGRRLLPLPRSITGVRPSSSRVRSAIFDRLQAEVVDARVLDLFAGSGALAIEALSRGAAHATLVERNRDLWPFLSAQLDALGLGSRTTVVRGDAQRFLTSSAATGVQARGRYDLVLVDPPYAELDLYGAVLDALVSGNYLADAAVIVMEVEKRRGQRPVIGLPDALTCEAVRDHGQTALEFLRFATLQRPPAPPELPPEPS